MAGQVATSVSLTLVYRNEMEDDFLSFCCLRAAFPFTAIECVLQCETDYRGEGYM